MNKKLHGKGDHMSDGVSRQLLHEHPFPLGKSDRTRAKAEKKWVGIREMRKS